MQQLLKKYLPEVILHLLFWLLVYKAIGSFTSLTIKYLENVSETGEMRIVKNSLYPLSFVLLGFLMFLFYANAYWLYTQNISDKNYYRFIVSICITVSAFFINYLLIYKLIAFSTLNAGQWKHLQINIALLFGFIWGLSFAYSFSKRWFKNETLQKQMQLHQVTTELNFLKSQINPHFLFNTLNNLFSIAQQDENDELATGIARLSEMMRYMIYESGAERVPLEKEIQYLKSFIELNKLRFKQDEVQIDFCYPDNCKGKIIAPMLLIPFVENAFKYGVILNGCSEINISIRLYDSEIIFCCENTDYSSVNIMNNDKGLGLQNVRRRLELIYPGAHSLEIKNENYKYSVLLQLYK